MHKILSIFQTSSGPTVYTFRQAWKPAKNNPDKDVSYFKNFNVVQNCISTLLKAAD